MTNNKEIATATIGGEGKDFRQTKNLSLMSDLNPYMLLSIDTPGALLIHIKLNKKITINGRLLFASS